ncbi:KR domain-containing protein, partial [Streptomyces sp. NPDC001920]
LRQPVRLTTALTTLHTHNVTTYLEIGPHPTLTTFANAPCRPTLHRDHPEPATVLTALTHAHTRGHTARPTGDRPPAPCVDLPTYPFQHRTYWLNPPQQEVRQAPEAEFWQAVEDGDLDALAATLRLSADRRDALGAVLPALSTYKRGQRWHYRLMWEPVPEPTGAGAPRTWLIVGHDQQLSTLLTARGDRVVGGGPDDVTAAVDGVLWLPGPQDTQTAAAAALAGLDAVAPVWVVTRAGAAVGREDAPADPGAAAFWGLSQALADGCPERRFGLIDLPREVDGAIADRMSRLLGAGDEPRVALRTTGAFAPRLVPVAPVAAAASRWEPKGTVVVTGAVTPLGERLVRWVAGHAGARVLLPVGVADGDRPELSRLAADLGDRVTVVPGDPAAQEDVARLWARAQEPITAVLHVAVDATERHDLEVAARLDAMARESGVETFVLVTSAAAVFTAPESRQDTAASLHASLDALAAGRRAAGHPVVALAVVTEWPETEPGAAVPPGVRAVPPEHVVALVEQAVQLDGKFLVVADVDWDELLGQPQGQVRRRLFQGVPLARRALRAAGVPGDGGAAGTSPTRLSDVPEGERLEFLLGLIRSESAAVLGHSAPDAVEVDVDFLSLGFSSITALELSNRLGAAGLDVELEPAAVYDHPTPAALARHLHDLLGGRAEVGPAATPSVTTP